MKSQLSSVAFTDLVGAFVLNSSLENVYLYAGSSYL